MKIFNEKIKWKERLDLPTQKGFAELPISLALVERRGKMADVIIFIGVIFVTIFFYIWSLYKAEELEQKRQRKEYYENIELYNRLVGKETCSADIGIREAAKAKLGTYITDSREEINEWRKSILVSGDADEIERNNEFMLKRDSILAKLKNDEAIPEEVYAESYFDAKTLKIY